jgi:hypothetical protein
MAEPEDTVSHPVRYLNPNPIAIWCCGKNAPLRMDDEDARLPNPGGGDQTFGQDRWKVGIDFANFRHLAEMLGGITYELPRFVCGNYLSRCGKIQENQIYRLAIMAHGGGGYVDIDCRFGSAVDGEQPLHQDPRFLNTSTFGKYSYELDLIERSLHERAKVFFMGCRIAAGAEGEDFLKQLSLRWRKKETFVIAITTIGYSGAQSKPGTYGASCYPGMRDTNYSNHKQPGMPTRDYEKAEYWNDLTKLPWASEVSPHAKIAFNGVLIK